jgi:predicted outer membrane protein
MIRKAPMLRRIPRLLRISVVIAVLLAVSASVYQTWMYGNAGLATTQTAFGPLTPQDRNLLIAVRLAGLWEGPTSEQAQQMASSAEVKEVGAKLAAEHKELDTEVRRVADQLGVQLPASPTTTQMGWMNQIAAQTGSDYDRTYIQIVREAHGNVLPVINDVRVSTRNDLIRQFAETSDAFVTRHCQYLESTGLVDYSRLPSTQATVMSALTSGYGPSGLIAPILVFVAVLLGVIALLAALRKKKGEPRSERVTVAKSNRPAASAPIPALAAALPVGSPGGGSAGPDISMPTVLPMDAPVGAGAAAPGSMTGTTVIPSPRSAGGPGPSVQWNLSNPGFQDSGPHPTIDAPAPYASVTDSGAFRIGSLPVDRGGPDMTGPVGYPIHDDHPAGYRPGGPVPNGYDSGYQQPGATGRYRTVSETGSHRAEPGAYGGSDSGSHRSVHSTGPRHSVRR